MSSLYGVRIDDGASQVRCRSLPFLACAPEDRGDTSRVITDTEEVIPIGVAAEALYLLGMINEGWDNGLDWWSNHQELDTERDDQIFVGKEIGELEICYSSGRSDRVPLIMGVTAWYFTGWASEQKLEPIIPPTREPFESRAELMGVLRENLLLREHPDHVRYADYDVPNHERYRQYYLALKPRPEVIDAIVIHDNSELRGRPLLSGVTVLDPEPASQLFSFGEVETDASDRAVMVDPTAPPDWSANAARLADALYTRESDLPDAPPLLAFPGDVKATHLRFRGGREADWLNNVWVANLLNIDEKFDPVTGRHNESSRDSLWYGVWSGVGTWTIAPEVGVYNPLAAARTSEHYATLALRCIDNPRRATAFVDYCDTWLYYFRGNRDPAKGPSNAGLDVERYPSDAPPHWSFILDDPNRTMTTVANELPGNEEMDGHGATMLGRWAAWRALESPDGEWLTGARAGVYGKSRWESTKDAAEFVCWFMDYTAMDVIFSEGESTHYGGPDHELIPPAMDEAIDLAAIRKNYANSNMYEVYPAYACLAGLRCSAELAMAANHPEVSERWLAYAQRIEDGMLRLLRWGDYKQPVWRFSPYSIFPSFQESLAPAWLAPYHAGLDPQRWRPEIATTTRNTLARQLDQAYGHAPVQAMGYGLGWLAESALILDEFDDAGPLLANIGRYAYDKHLDFVDEARDIDGRRFQWLISEGVNLLPDGSWHRIGDLTNGAHLTALHALEAAAGIDDANPLDVRILPRLPAPLTGIEVRDFPMGVSRDGRFERVRISYRFERPGTLDSISDRAIPDLAVRLGPFDEASALRAAASVDCARGGSARTERSGSADGEPAWWVWVEGLQNIDSLSLDLSTS